MDGVVRSSETDSPPRVSALVTAESRAFKPAIQPRPYEAMRVRNLSLFFLYDVVAIAAGFIVGGAIRLGSPVNDQTGESLAIVLPIFILVALNNRAYSLASLERPWVGIKRSLKALIYACAVAMSLLFYMKWSEQFSRAIFAIGTASAFALIAGTRWMIGNYLGHRYNWTFQNRLVIVDEVRFVAQPGDRIVFADRLGFTPDSDDPAIAAPSGRACRTVR